MATYMYQAEQKSCALSSEFGRDYACKVFALTPEQLERRVGRFARGKRKGMLRGAIAWRKVTRGGWVKTGAYDFDENRACGFVVRPGLTYGHALFDGTGSQIEGPGPRVNEATMIADEMRRRGHARPATVPTVTPYEHPPVWGSDAPATAPYLFIENEAWGSLGFEAVRHRETLERAQQFGCFTQEA